MTAGASLIANIMACIAKGYRIIYLAYTSDSIGTCLDLAYYSTKESTIYPQFLGLWERPDPTGLCGLERGCQGI